MGRLRPGFSNLGEFSKGLYIHIRAEVKGRPFPYAFWEHQKDHAHALRDIEAMFIHLKIQANDFLDSYKDSIGRTLKKRNKQRSKKK